jgi:hypothetical protein
VVQSPQRILRGVRPEDVLSVYGSRLNPTKEQEARAIPFEGGAGAPLVGRAVFSVEKAMELKEKDPSLKVVLLGAKNSNVAFMHAAIIDGATSFSEEPTAHYKEVAWGRGVSILSANFQHVASVDCVLGKNTLQHKNGVVCEGDIVSIDPELGLLYPEEIALVPASKPDGFELFKKLIDQENQDYDGLRFMPQIDTEGDMSLIQEDPALSKIENYFIYEPEGKVVLNEYLFDPTEERLARVKEFLKNYIREKIVGALDGKNLRQPTFRLMDFKPENLLLDMERLGELEALVELEDVTGTQLFEILPELYRIQVEAVLEEIPPYYVVGDDAYSRCLGVEPNFVIPKVHSIEHYDDITKDVHKVAERVWGSDWINVSVLPMIEGVSSAGPDFVALLAKRLGQIQQVGGSSCSSSSIMYIGGSDLMSDIMGGIRRTDEVAIQEWMEEEWLFDHPFKSIVPEMSNVLRQIVDVANENAVKSICFRFCGIQAQHLGAAEALEKLGIDQVVVPAQKRFLEGLPLATFLKRVQSFAPCTEELEEERVFQKQYGSSLRSDVVCEIIERSEIP